MTSRDDLSPEMKAATEELDAAVRKVWGLLNQEEDYQKTWERTPREDRMLTEWLVLVGVHGNGESSVDMLFPDFPEVPMHHAKGLLIDALDNVRAGDAYPGG